MYVYVYVYASKIWRTFSIDIIMFHFVLGIVVEKSPINFFLFI